MTVQENALKAYYASLTDAELLKLADNRSSFIDAAQQAMASELLSRHLAPRADPVPAAPEPSGLRALVKRLARVLPGQRK
jgi:hypothetical protein